MSESLARALVLLRKVADGVDTLDALAAETHVHKTTVLRQLATLLEHGFVVRDAGHHYRLGPAVYDLARSARDPSDVMRAAPPVLRELSRATGHTVHLAGLAEGVVRYLDKVEPDRGLHMASRIGHATPLHATAVGKVLLAGLGDHERRGLVDRLVLERYTARTIVDRQVLLAEADQVARRGWSLDHEEHEPFMICIGAPVHGADGAVVAAMSISVPNVVLGLDEVVALVPALRAAAERVSADLGYGPAASPRKESP
jgi:DNA-binding IclR family transcriptional regulator